MIENRSLFFTGIVISQIGVVLIITHYVGGGILIAFTGMAMMIIHLVCVLDSGAPIKKGGDSDENTR